MLRFGPNSVLYSMCSASCILRSLARPDRAVYKPSMAAGGAGGARLLSSSYLADDLMGTSQILGVEGHVGRGKVDLLRGLPVPAVKQTRADPRPVTLLQISKLRFRNDGCSHACYKSPDMLKICQLLLLMCR